MQPRRLEQHVAHQRSSERTKGSLHLQTCGRWPARHQTFPSNFTGWTISSVPSQPGISLGETEIFVIFLVELSCVPTEPSNCSASSRGIPSVTTVNGFRFWLCAVFLISRTHFFPRAATLLATAAASRPAAARRR